MGLRVLLLLFLGFISLAGAHVSFKCESENIWGNTVYFKCPNEASDPEDIFCCGDKENRYCCSDPEGIIAVAAQGSKLTAALKNQDQTNHYPKLSDSHAEPRSIVKGVAKLIGIIVGIVIFVILLFLVCCCCCPCCLLAKSRSRGRVLREGGQEAVPPRGQGAQGDVATYPPQQPVGPPQVPYPQNFPPMPPQQQAPQAYPQYPPQQPLYPAPKQPQYPSPQQPMTAASAGYPQPPPYPGPPVQPTLPVTEVYQKQPPFNPNAP